MAARANEAGRPILVGTSGWAYEDWRGRFYPARPPRGFDPLAYLARYFDAVEVNSSFYRPPDPRAVARWLRRTPSAFLFAFKLHRRFTHERGRPWSGEEAAEFLRAVEPAAEADRLGAVLVQFPWSFRAGPEAFAHLEAVARDFGRLPLVLEVRHAGWAAPEAVARVRDLGLGFCNIDQPASRSGLGPTSLVTSPVGYVRLHGRNREAWFAPEAGRDARYDYLYREDELAGWLDRIRAVARRAERTFVFTNNHYRGQAPANALQILAGLLGRRVPVPSTLLRAYPVLKSVAAEELAPGEQGTLF